MTISVLMHHKDFNPPDHHQEIYNDVKSLYCSGNILRIQYVNDKGLNAESYIDFRLNPDLIVLAD